MKKEEGWLWLASHLHKGLQEVKQITTSSEFLLWMTYREFLNNDFSKLDYYLAQICLVIAKAIGGSKESTIDNFLLHFHTKEELAKLELDEDEEEEMENAANSARGMMQGITGTGMNNGRGMGGDISIPKRGE